MTNDVAPNPEPTGYTIDGVPWDEPHGPHLPDVIARLSMLVWPFLALAAMIGYRAIRMITGDTLRDPGMVLESGLAAIPSVVTPLLGAAYFATHRGVAFRSAMAIGVTLLAAGQAMRLVQSPVLNFFGSFLLSSGDAFADIERSSLYFAFVSAVEVAAFVCLLRGLRSARHRPSAPGQRGLTLVVFGVAAVTVVLGLQSIGLSSPGDDGEFLAINFRAWLLNAVSTVATAAVTAELLAGARAAERPAVAWRLAAAAMTFLLVAQVPTWVLYAMGPESMPLITAMSWTLVIAEAIAFVMWLGAFVLGLPSQDAGLPPA
jgi:hypothetical protein